MSPEKNNITFLSNYNVEIALGFSAFFGLLALIILIMPFFSMAWSLTVAATVIAIIFLSMAVIFLMKPLCVEAGCEEIVK